MLNRQRLNAVEHQLSLIDQEIVELAADGYLVDVDRKLDERREQQRRRDALHRGEVPNG
jgi:hypothetical protein